MSAFLKCLAPIHFHVAAIIVSTLHKYWVLAPLHNPFWLAGTTNRCALSVLVINIMLRSTKCMTLWCALCLCYLLLATLLSRTHAPTFHSSFFVFACKVCSFICWGREGSEIPCLHAPLWCCRYGSTRFVLVVILTLLFSEYVQQHRASPGWKKCALRFSVLGPRVRHGGWAQVLSILPGRVQCLSKE